MMTSLATCRSGPDEPLDRGRQVPAHGGAAGVGDGTSSASGQARASCHAVGAGPFVAHSARHLIEASKAIG
ncbi:MAG: hypothetical protein JWR81_2281 [Pseudonocardia sp.]|jgi:hypothetical protein|nr:hypothetical protein [Pseudonocardia sp.]MDT7612985.1 hypothetical protein [Pseudonocardiales bacterium]